MSPLELDKVCFLRKDCSFVESICLTVCLFRDVAISVLSQAETGTFLVLPQTLLLRGIDHVHEYQIIRENKIGWYLKVSLPVILNPRLTEDAESDYYVKLSHHNCDTLFQQIMKLKLHSFFV